MESIQKKLLTSKIQIKGYVKVLEAIQYIVSLYLLEIDGNKDFKLYRKKLNGLLIEKTSKLLVGVLALVEK